MMTQQNSEGAGELSQPCTDISTSCSVIGNKPFRKNYHLGGKKYAIFHRERDVIDHIQIKEWDGKVVIKEGVKLNKPVQPVIYQSVSLKPLLQNVVIFIVPYARYILLPNREDLLFSALHVKRRSRMKQPKSFFMRPIKLPPGGDWTEVPQSLN